MPFANVIPRSLRATLPNENNRNDSWQKCYSSINAEKKRTSKAKKNAEIDFLMFESSPRIIMQRLLELEQGKNLCFVLNLFLHFCHDGKSKQNYFFSSNFWEHMHTSTRESEKERERKGDERDRESERERENLLLSPESCSQDGYISGKNCKTWICFCLSNLNSKQSQSKSESQLVCGLSRACDVFSCASRCRSKPKVRVVIVSRLIICIRLANSPSNLKPTCFSCPNHLFLLPSDFKLVTLHVAALFNSNSIVWLLADVHVKIKTQNDDLPEICLPSHTFPLSPNYKCKMQKGKLTDFQAALTWQSLENEFACRGHCHWCGRHPTCHPWASQHGLDTDKHPCFRWRTHVVRMRAAETAVWLWHRHCHCCPGLGDLDTDKHPCLRVCSIFQNSYEVRDSCEILASCNPVRDTIFGRKIERHLRTFFALVKIKQPPYISPKQRKNSVRYLTEEVAPDEGVWTCTVARTGVQAAVEQKCASQEQRKLPWLPTETHTHS